MGSLLKLVAMGAQDHYLSNNPQITFFNHTFSRHTNFAFENKFIEYQSDNSSEIVLNGEDCSICLEKIEIAHKTECGHIFCKSCIEEWYKRNSTCPLCRKKITHSNHHNPTNNKNSNENEIYIYARNYNLLNIFDGYASLRYSN